MVSQDDERLSAHTRNETVLLIIAYRQTFKVMVGNVIPNHRRVEVGIAKPMGLTGHGNPLWRVGMHNPLGLRDMRVDSAMNNKTSGIHRVVGFTHRIAIDIDLHKI